MPPQKPPKKKLPVPQNERDAKRAHALRAKADHLLESGEELRQAAWMLENGGPRALSLYHRIKTAEKAAARMRHQLKALVGPWETDDGGL